MPSTMTSPARKIATSASFLPLRRLRPRLGYGRLDGDLF
jgi:hypothetical protein